MTGIARRLWGVPNVLKEGWSYCYSGNPEMFHEDVVSAASELGRRRDRSFADAWSFFLIAGSLGVAIALAVMPYVPGYSITYCAVTGLHAAVLQLTWKVDRGRGMLRATSLADGVKALGGIGALSATKVRAVRQAEELRDLRDILEEWLDAQALSHEEREVFEALVGEYDGSMIELCETCRAMCV
jgi:hypothetical protein